MDRNYVNTIIKAACLQNKGFVTLKKIGASSFVGDLPADKLVLKTMGYRVVTEKTYDAILLELSYVGLGFQTNVT